MTGKQPKALRLAEQLEFLTKTNGGMINVFISKGRLREAAAELRRLNEVNAELVEAVKAALSDDQPYIERCKAALVKATGEQQ
jgi:hypothetical protein